MKSLVENITAEQKYRDSLPQPFVDISMGALLTLQKHSLRCGFLNYCKGQITLGKLSYEELFDQEGASPEHGTMWFIWQRNDSPEKAIVEIDKDIEHELSEMMTIIGVSDLRALTTFMSKVEVACNFPFYRGSVLRDRT